MAGITVGGVLSGSDVLTGRSGGRGGCAVLLPISIFQRGGCYLGYHSWAAMHPCSPKPLRVPLPAVPWIFKSLPAEPDPCGMQDALLLPGRSPSRQPRDLMLLLPKIWASLPGKRRDGNGLRKKKLKNIALTQHRGRHQPRGKALPLERDGSA